MSIDWTEKLRHLLQVLAFCLGVAAVQYGFQPDRPYGPLAIYSLAIGTITWAVIDLGRHLFASSTESGWPPGLQGLGLIVAGIAAGYLLGSRIGDALSLYLGLYPTGAAPHRQAQLRTSVLITGLAGIAGSYYFYSKNKSAYLQRKMREAHRHASQARLKLLETQLEPHMLFNTLANLRALIAADPARAQIMLDHMIAYLRSTLNASRVATHSLQAEFDRLRDYLELMAIRMGPRLSFELQLPPELAGTQVPALLLQPLVENSIQHGLEPKVEGGRITVLARREGGELVLEVADSGVGPGTAPGPGKGFGMSHVRERLDALHGPAATLQFAGAPQGGSRATLRLPLQP